MNHNELIGLDLDRYIAARRGWREVETRKAWIEDLHDTYEREYLEGIPPGETISTSIVPAYSLDSDAALTLFPDTCTLSISYRAKVKGKPEIIVDCTEYAGGGVYHMLYPASGDTLPLALCYAFCMYDDDHN